VSDHGVLCCWLGLNPHNKVQAGKTSSKKDPPFSTAPVASESQAFVARLLGKPVYITDILQVPVKNDAQNSLWGIKEGKAYHHWHSEFWLPSATKESQNIH